MSTSNGGAEMPRATAPRRMQAFRRIAISCPAAGYEVAGVGQDKITRSESS
jgi:hypothetical protein